MIGTKPFTILLDAIGCRCKHQPEDTGAFASEGATCAVRAMEAKLAIMERDENMPAHLLPMV